MAHLYDSQGGFQNGAVIGRPLSSRIQKSGRWTRGEKDEISINKSSAVF